MNLRSHHLVYLIFVIFSLLTIQVPAQESRIDSLAGALSSMKADTNKVNALIEIGLELNRSAPNEALKYCEEAIKLASELDYKKGLAQAYKTSGLAYYFLGSYAETINQWNSSRSHFEAMNDQSGIANILSNMGAVYTNFGEDNKALDLFFEAQKAAEQIGDSLRLVTTIINIGLIYLKKESTLKQAQNIYKAALPIAEALGDQDAIGTAAVNLGETYFKLGDDDTALIYYNRSLEAFSKNLSGNIPFALTSIGRVYAREKNFEAALENQKKAYEMAKLLEAKPNMVLALLGMAETFQLKQDLSSAIESYGEAKNIAEEIGGNFELRDALEGLANAYAELSDYMMAYTFQKQLTAIKDTINQSSNQNLIVRQQLSFDLDKKQAELELQELEVQKQRLVKNAFLAGLLLILIIAFIIFRNYLNKVKINKLLDKQKIQIETLLLNILPKKVAEELQEKGEASPKFYDQVSVLFTDFKGFTSIAEGMSPNELVSELNQFFQAFDNIVEKHNLEKIKTIGDAYMCAGGIPTENKTHPFDAINAGLEMHQFMDQINQDRTASGKPAWNLRIGIHTGPIVAGVVGRKKYAYDIWGNTVNIASRMESNGEVGKVNISQNTYELVKDKYRCEHRGKISAKNLGEIDMYFAASIQ